MGIVYALVMLSIILVGFAVWAFFWAVKNDQFDDLDTPAYSILEDDESPPAAPVSGNSRPRPTPSTRPGEPADHE